MARPAGWEKRHLLGSFMALGEHLDGAPPGRLLAVVDLAEIKHLALDHPAAPHPTVLDEAPGAVDLAVFAPGQAREETCPESAEPPPSRSTG